MVLFNRTKRQSNVNNYIWEPSSFYFTKIPDREAFFFIFSNWKGKCLPLRLRSVSDFFFLEPILQVLLLYLTNNARWEVILSGIPPRQLCSFCISSALSFPKWWASKTIGTVPSLRVSSPGPSLHCFLPWLPPQKANTRVQPVSHISKAGVLNDIVLS